MTTRADLSAAVAELSAATVLPVRRAGDAGLPDGRCRLVEVLPLGADGRLGSDGAEDVGVGPWLTVVRLSDGTLVGAPLLATGHDPLIVRRAVAGDGAGAALLERLADPQVTAAQPGPFDIRLVSEPVAVDRAAGERGFDVDQTHDSVVVGEAVVVKWTARVTSQPGEPPSVRLLRQLSAAGFTTMPRPVGQVLWRDSGSGIPAVALLASATEYLPDASDGWDWYVDDVAAHLSGDRILSDAVAPAAALGALVARFHVALATPTPVLDEPVKASEPQAAQHWLAAALARLDEAVTVTTGEPGRRLRQVAARARELLDPLRSIDSTPMTLVHGDLHVGQVLRWAGGYALNDFDGNPVVDPADVQPMQPPARDVAGMMQSLDHVGRIAARRTHGGSTDQLLAWRRCARRAFLDTYRDCLAQADLAHLLDERLLVPFSVEQECREYVYAARHLPAWTHVPDAALPELLEEAG